mmetsp:Transcript_3936/g.5512  ORF Transcript_3936/g.5512 Transcript_3936/m.5512 type:complete len:219 (+) Transcript_3936:534-1190(+)
MLDVFIVIRVVGHFVLCVEDHGDKFEKVIVVMVYKLVLVMFLFLIEILRHRPNRTILNHVFPSLDEVLMFMMILLLLLQLPTLVIVLIVPFVLLVLLDVIIFNVHPVLFIGVLFVKRNGQIPITLVETSRVLPIKEVLLLLVNIFFFNKLTITNSKTTNWLFFLLLRIIIMIIILVYFNKIQVKGGASSLFFLKQENFVFYSPSSTYVYLMILLQRIF